MARFGLGNGAEQMAVFRSVLAIPSMKQQVVVCAG